MTNAGRLGLLLALLIIAATALGCGKTVIDDEKTEGAIQHNLETSLKEKVESVDCPSGVEVKAGTTFDCTIELKGGGGQTATLKIIDDEADVEVVGLKPSGQTGGE